MHTHARAARLLHQVFPPESRSWTMVALLSYWPGVEKVKITYAIPILPSMTHILESVASCRVRSQPLFFHHWSWLDRYNLEWCSFSSPRKNAENARGRDSVIPMIPSRVSVFIQYYGCGYVLPLRITDFRSRGEKGRNSGEYFAMLTILMQSVS